MALAKWFKIDFHTHTPASNCFRDKSISAKQWVEAAKSAGLDAVVITDHNSVAYISKIEALEIDVKKDIKIFYGIELSVSAYFTHILIIFDDKLSQSQIEDAVTGNLKLKRDVWGDTTVNVTEERLEELCSAMKGHIFVIPAHFAAEKGLGKCSINAIKKYKEFVRFDAIEVRNEEDVKEYENKVKNNIINRAALVSGSDNPSTKDPATHSIEGFGSAFTWIKTSSLSFEGLRQVFLDPENRCINMMMLNEIGKEFNPNEVTNNYISGIKLEGFVHLSNLNMRFSSGLNCIIGGRGTGKSTVLEAIKYGLNCGQDLSACKLLEKTMTREGRITTFFNFGISNEYEIEATRERKNLKYVYKNKDGELNDPPEFKIEFYGQKEIFSLLEEDSDTSSTETSPLIKMIDDGIETELFRYHDRISSIVTELRQQASIFRNNRKKIAKLPLLKAEEEKAEAILSRFKASGLEETRKEYELLGGYIKTTSAKVNSCLGAICKTIEFFEALRDEYGLTFAKLKDDAEMNRENIVVIDTISQSCDRIIDKLLNEQSIIESAKNDHDCSDVHQQLNQLHEKYLLAIESVKNTGSEDIKTIQDKLQTDREQIHAINKMIDGQKDIQDNIKKLIDQLIICKLELSEARRRSVSEMQMEAIEFTVSSMAHVQRFKSNLQREFGHDSFEDDYIKLAEKILEPDSNYEMLKKYLLFVLTSETGDLGEIGLSEFSLRFMNNWKEKCKSGTMDSLINVLPEDKVDISIIDNGNEIDINDGSPGQKCAALLAFILNSGNNPLIIDQPEDDLDNSLIYNLVVKSLRIKKKKRQIIIVTHNPNIPVLGDAEGIIVLERNSEGKVVFRNSKKAGCIEEKEIRQGICEIMEGGVEAFKKREAKYSMRNLYM